MDAVEGFGLGLGLGLGLTLTLFLTSVASIPYMTLYSGFHILHTVVTVMKFAADVDRVSS